MSPDVFSTALRALSFLALMQAAGATLFVLLFGGRLLDSVGRIQQLGRWAGLISVPLLLGQFALEPARMADELRGVFDPSLQRLVLASTASVVLLARLAGLGILAIAGRRPGSSLRFLGAFGAVLLAASFALTGHTAVHPLRLALAPLLTAHTLIVAFWFGSLLPLYLVTVHETRERAGNAIEAFSVIAMRSVPWIALTGLVMALLLVRQMAVLAQPYGRLLLLKVGGFVVLMGLAALNRWRFGPAVAAGSGEGVLRLRRSLVAEYALIVGVLTATAIMTSFFSPD